MLVKLPATPGHKLGGARALISTPASDVYASCMVVTSDGCPVYPSCALASLVAEVRHLLLKTNDALEVIVRDETPAGMFERGLGQRKSCFYIFTKSHLRL